MATTISDGTTTISPAQVLGYEASTDSRSVFHTIIGKDADDVSLAGDSTRTGTLTLLFPVEADAAAARAALTHPAVWTLTDNTLPTIGMTFVRKGRLTLTLDETTHAAWTLAVEYQEV